MREGEADVERAVQMYLDGVKTSDITEATGVSRPRLYYLLERRGITPQRTRRFPRTSFTTEGMPTLADPMAGAAEQIRWLAQQLLEQERELGRLEGVLEAAREMLRRSDEQVGELRQQLHARWQQRGDCRE